MLLLREIIKGIPAEDTAEGEQGAGAPDGGDGSAAPSPGCGASAGTAESSMRATFSAEEQPLAVVGEGEGARADAAAGAAAAAAGAAAAADDDDAVGARDGTSPATPHLPGAVPGADGLPGTIAPFRQRTSDRLAVDEGGAPAGAATGARAGPSDEALTLADARGTGALLRLALERILQARAHDDR